VDLVSYADLAARLVNTAARGNDQGDGLATAESYRGLVADLPQLASRVTAADLEALRLLRGELRLVFQAVADDDPAGAVERLNALLIRHPIHQQITGHDSQPWHLHLVESGSAADRYAAAAVAGLTGLVTRAGIRRLRACASSTCERVFIGDSSGGKQFCSDRCAPKANVRALRASGRARGHDPASPAAS
jgi:Putative stress-induced transcription regulator/CGNR zinc finger